MFASDCARLIGTCGKQSCQMLDQSQWQTVIWDGREGNEVSPITTFVFWPGMLFLTMMWGGGNQAEAGNLTELRKHSLNFKVVKVKGIFLERKELHKDTLEICMMFPL